MDLWVWWMIAAVAFAVGEMAIMGFFLAPFAGGAFVAALVALAGAGAAVSIVVFAVDRRAAVPVRAPDRAAPPRRSRPRCAPAPPR